MIEELTSVQGFFSTPTVPGVYCCGTLVYSPTEGIRLELLGHLGAKGYYPRGERKLDVIHGTLENGKLVSLFDCRGYESTRMPGYGKSKLSAELLVYGVKADKLDDLKVRTGICRFVNQEDWIDRRGLRASSTRDDSPKYKVTFKQPKAISVVDTTQFKLLIWFSYSIPIGSRLRSIDERFEVKSYFNYQYKHPVSVSQFLDDTKTLEHFLGLVTNQSTPLSYSSITTIDHPKHHDGFQLFYYHHPIQPSERELYDEDFLFTFKQMKPRLPRLYGQWMALHEKVRTALDLYFDHLYDTTRYEINKFVYYSFAFESIHRRMNKGYKKYPAVEYAKLCDRLIEATPKKYKRHVASSVRNRNDFSLSERYASVLDELRSTNRFFDSEKVTKYLKKIVASRNHMAHDGTLGDGSDKYVTDENVWQYNMLLQLIITYALLRESGISKRSLTQALNKPRMFGFLSGRDGM
jgi:hypothetical protein